MGGKSWVEDSVIQLFLGIFLQVNSNVFGKKKKILKEEAILTKPPQQKVFQQSIPLLDHDKSFHQQR